MSTRQTENEPGMIPELAHPPGDCGQVEEEGGSTESGIMINYLRGSIRHIRKTSGHDHSDLSVDDFRV